MDKYVKVALVLSASDRASMVVERALTKAEKRVKSFEQASQRMHDAGNKSLVAGAAVMGGVAASVKQAADVERMQVALQSSFRGSAKEAERAFGIINTFAEATPYGLEEVMTGFIKLKNLGLDPSIDSLTSYGNTAAAMGKSLNDMVEAVADATTGEFERLKEFGIKAASQGKYVTFTFQGVKTVVKKESADIERYLRNVGNVNFAGGMAAQSKTFWGQWSTLGDNVRMTVAALGKLLLPTLNALFARIKPVIDRVQQWVTANPALAKSLMHVAASVGVALLAVGGTLKVIGFITSTVGGSIRTVSALFRGVKTATAFAVQGFQAIKFAAFAVQYAMKFSIVPALKAAGSAVVRFGMTLLASPITWYIAAAVALGAVVYLVIRNWSKISGFFANLWAGVKNVFSRFFNWAKVLFLNFTPLGLFIKHWDKLPLLFSKIWENVKGVFTGAWDFVVNLGSKFFDAGKNIVSSLWRGMVALASKPVEVMASIVKKIRDYLPFSPAKVGPLRDIHRVKLVETVAQSISAKPLVNAWSGAMGNFRRRLQPAIGGYGMGGAAPVNFNVTINLNGTATQQDATNLFDTFRVQAERWWSQRQHYSSRVRF